MGQRAGFNEHEDKYLSDGGLDARNTITSIVNSIEQIQQLACTILDKYLVDIIFERRYGGTREDDILRRNKVRVFS